MLDASTRHFVCKTWQEPQRGSQPGQKLHPTRASKRNFISSTPFVKHHIYSHKVPLRGTFTLPLCDQASHLFEAARMVFSHKAGSSTRQRFQRIFRIVGECANTSPFHGRMNKWLKLTSVYVSTQFLPDTKNNIYNPKQPFFKL